LRVPQADNSERNYEKQPGIAHFTLLLTRQFGGVIELDSLSHFLPPLSAHCSLRVRLLLRVLLRLRRLALPALSSCLLASCLWLRLLTYLCLCFFLLSLCYLLLLLLLFLFFFFFFSYIALFHLNFLFIYS